MSFTTADDEITQKEFEVQLSRLKIDLIELNIYDSPKIYKIPYLNKLKRLDCSLTNISSIPFMKKLRELGCGSCKKLSEIPNLPNLRKLGCDATNISFIPLMRKLRELYCHGCPNLIKIPNFPNLIILYCDNNLKIKFYNKNLRINHRINTIAIQHLQGRLYQNNYRAYELLMF